MTIAAYPLRIQKDLEADKIDVDAVKLGSNNMTKTKACAEKNCVNSIMGHAETIGGKNGGGGETTAGTTTTAPTSLFRERRWGGQGYKGIIH